MFWCEQLRRDIQDFKTQKNLDKVLIMWAGNTERFAELLPGLNDTWAGLENAIKSNASEVAPSTLYAVASILENVTSFYPPIQPYVFNTQVAFSDAPFNFNLCAFYFSVAS